MAKSPPRQKGAVVNRATPEGTRRYALRHAAHLDAFSAVEGLQMSTLGVGSYAPEPYWEATYEFSYEAAIKTALLNGCNHLDTAVNYRFRQSEREVGAAIKAAIESGEIRRDEIVVATKAGFLPQNYPFPENPYHWIADAVVKPGLATEEQIITDQHCMTPAYLEQSLAWSLENLGLEAVDVFYLHNPEMQLGHVDYPAFLERIEAAFETFEKMADRGQIGAYGVATWNALTWEEGHMEYVKLLDLVRIAQKVGGANHRFKFVQLPFNLAKPHAFNYTNQPLEDWRYYTPVQAANALGLNVIASSSLLRMALFQRPFSPKAAALIGGGFANAVQYALQFARSAPGVKSALFSTTSAEHMLEDLAVLKTARTKSTDFNALFQL